MNTETMDVNYAMTATDIETYTNINNQTNYVRKIINNKCLPPMQMIVRRGMNHLTVEQLDILIDRCSRVMTCYYDTESSYGKYYKEWRYCKNRLKETAHARMIPVTGRMAIIINKLGGRDIESNDYLRDDELHQLSLECKREAREYCTVNVNPMYYIWKGLELELLGVIRDRVTVAMNERMMCRVIVNRLTRELAKATVDAEAEEKKWNDHMMLVSGINDKIIRGKGGCPECIYHGTGDACAARNHLCHKGHFHFIPKKCHEQGLMLIKNKDGYCDKCYYNLDYPSCSAGRAEGCGNGKLIYVKDNHHE